MDDRERDRFYASTPDAADEYELEPPDPEVLAREERRAREAIEATRTSIDIDEIYREVERERGSEILDNWARDFRFQFRIKHLLIATAVLAILLTLAKLGLGTVVVLFVMMSVAGLFLYLQWQEKKHQDEAERRRQLLYARRRAQLDQGSGAEAAESPREMPPVVPDPLPSETDEIWAKANARREFRFRFSMRELMAAMTAAALIFGLVHLLGGASNTATLLGFIALFGLVVHALGFEPPEIVVFGWWLVLVLYVLLSVVAVVWKGMA